MNIISKIFTKIFLPSVDVNRFQGKESSEIPTSKELRYKTLQKVFSILASSIDFESNAQNAVDVMSKEMDYFGGVLFIYSEQKRELIPWCYTNTTLVKTVASWLPKPFREYTYSMELADSSIVKTFIENKIFESDGMKLLAPVVDLGYLARVTSFMGIQSSISVPVSFQGKPLGVLWLGSSRVKATDEERQMLITFSEQVGITINNSLLYEKINNQVNQLGKQNEDLQSLYNLTSQISKSLDITTVAQTAVNSLPQDKFIVGSILAEHKQDENILQNIALTENALYFQVTKIIDDPKKYKLQLGTPETEFNLASKAFKQATPQFSNALKDFLAPTLPGPLISAVEAVLKIKSVASYPLIIRGVVIGTLTFLIKDKTVEELTESEKQLLGTYTYHITIALENAELYKQQKETQANLENALAEVQALRQHEQDMIDIMGHELRTPISIVRNALGMLELELKNTGEIKKENLGKFLDISMESARREVKLVETLLSSAKADSRGFQLLFEKVDYLDVVNDSLEFFTREAEKKGLQIKYTKPTEEIFVYTDRTRVQEVMDNLLSNSVKYTDTGFIKISIRTEGDYAWIDVNDTGIGMNEQDMKSIGQKFYRVDQYMDNGPAATPKEEKPNIIRPGGTGLGLYVTFSLIKVMDGKVNVESKLGVGSTFSFAMPLYKGQESKQEQRKP